MTKTNRFHLFRRDERPLDNNYTHSVLVLAVDGHEIELTAKDADDLVVLLQNGQLAMGWQHGIARKQVPNIMDIASSSLQSHLMNASDIGDK